MLQTRGMLLNPLKPNSSNYYTLAFKPNLPFLISDIQALRRSERQSAWMSEIKNGSLCLYSAEHSKCNHRMTLGFKGLMQCLVYNLNNH